MRHCNECQWHANRAVRPEPEITQSHHYVAYCRFIFSHPDFFMWLSSCRDRNWSDNECSHHSRVSINNIWRNVSLFFRSPFHLLAHYIVCRKISNWQKIYCFYRIVRIKVPSQPGLDWDWLIFQGPGSQALYFNDHACLPPCCAGSGAGQENSGVSAHRRGLREACQTMGGPVFSRGTLWMMLNIFPTV